jgi:hypothetical protein
MPANDVKQAKASGCSVGGSRLHACCTLRATSTLSALAAQTVVNVSRAAGAGTVDSAAAAAQPVVSCHCVPSASGCTGMVPSRRSAGTATCTACCRGPTEPADAAASTTLSVGAAAAGSASLLPRRAVYGAERLISCAHARRHFLPSAACTAGDLSTAHRACTLALVNLGLVVLGND